MSDDSYLKCSCKECGNHIEFPEKSAGTVEACPHCGQWTELIPDEPSPTPALDGGEVIETPATLTGEESITAAASSRKFLGLAVLLGCVVLALAIGGFFFLRIRAKAVAPVPVPIVKAIATPTNPPEAKPVVAEKPKKSLADLKVGTVQLEKAKVGSLVYAVGVVTNDSEFQRFGVQIELELFSQNGKRIGVAKDYKDIIEPNREWQFHALIPDARTTSAKVSSIKED
jgi:hypothetical protein